MKNHLVPILGSTSEDHRRAFEALTGGEAGNHCLFSCFISGRPAAAIAAVTVCPRTRESRARIRHFSVVHSINDNMDLTGHDGRRA